MVQYSYNGTLSNNENKEIRATWNKVWKTLKYNEQNSYKKDYIDRITYVKFKNMQGWSVLWAYILRVKLKKEKELTNNVLFYPSNDYMGVYLIVIN